MNIASFLTSPLTLVGLLLVGVFGLFKLVLKSRLLSKVTGKETALILHKMLNFGFVLALSVAIAGVGLEAWRIHKRIDHIKQAKKAIVGEILTNISSLDERLGFFNATLEPDTFAGQLDQVRQKIAPGLKQDFAAGYNHLIIEHKINTLRQLMNSSPLPTASGRSFMEYLRDSGMDTEIFRKFYLQLAEVERVTEDFLAALAYSETVGDKPSALQTEYSARRLQVAKQLLFIESQVAHFYALAILRYANTGPDAASLPDSAVSTLQALEHLQPKEPVDQQEASFLLTKILKTRSDELEEKAALVPLAKQLRQEKLSNLEEIDQQLTINPTDTWSQVVAKAISLRQLGRTTEAIAVFSRYGEMFAATDPTARLYAHTAQQLTLQADMLSISGGVYVFKITPGSAAQIANLKAGDIIIAYNGEDISDMSAFIKAVKSAQKKETVSITWLRLNAQNHFERYDATVPGGPLGAANMPI